MKSFVYKISLFIFAFLLLSGSCEDENKPTKPTLDQPTENIVKSTFYNDYAKDWKTVDSLDKIGLVKSALDVVNKIQVKARQEHNQPMQVKVLMYQLKYYQHLEENSFVLALNRIDTLQKENEQPLQQILSSIKAEMLFSYYSNNRYRFYNRSTTQNFDLGDVTTWDLKTLFSEIQRLYLTSLENKEILQKTPLKEYSYILQETNDGAFELLPTVYDFLAFRALDAFDNEETGITRPLAKFDINQPAYFGTDAAFMAISTQSEDTLSNWRLWVQTMQELTKFHQEENLSICQLNLTLKRLKFALDKSTLTTKSDAYLQALEREKLKYASSPLVANIHVEQIIYYVNHHQEDNPDEASYFYFKKAHQLCTETIQKYPKSVATGHCRSFIHQIEDAVVRGNVEQYNYPNQPILAQVEFKNTETLYALVFKYTKEDDDEKGYNSLKERLKGKQLVQNQTIKLPKSDDYNTHTTEIALKSLPIGSYYLVYTTDTVNFKPADEHQWYAAFQVTELNYSIASKGNNISTVFVSDRMTGKPVSKAAVTLIQQKYNYSSRKYVENRVETYTTDENGLAQVQKPINNGYYSNFIEVKKGNDLLKFSHYIYGNNTKPTAYQQDYIYTDRAIYRPGQTVYFKGIRLETLDKKSKIVPNQKVKITLKDVNYQDVKTIELITNDFGSFSGSFQLPSSGLTGNMSLKSDKGSFSFSVEEYKRPTFKVNFKKSTKEYQLGDQIQVNGEAIAYAGNSVDKATVAYTVKRTISMPYWCYWYYRVVPVFQTDVVVATGTSKTNEKGEFTIAFPAEKDATNTYENLNYTYVVQADVTDENGETRSKSKSLYLSDKALNLSVSTSSWDKAKESEIQVATTNSEGEKIAARGEVKIWKLKTDNTLPKRKRNWTEPDQPLLSKADFEKLFPEILYASTNELERPTEGEAKNYSFDSEKSNTIRVNTKSWETGEYKIITTTKDKNGKEVKDIQFITLTDNQSSKAQPNEWLQVNCNKTSYEPGDVAVISISSILTNQSILMETNLDGVIIEQKILTLNNEQKTLSFKIAEQHRGGISFHFYAVRLATPLSKTCVLNVPYTNKDLQISFETFRDKLLPGQNEEWRLRITGAKKEKVAAELLVSMYDASLDAFKSNAYNFNPYRQNSNYLNRASFGYGNSHGIPYGGAYSYAIQSALEKQNTISLNWFGYYPMNYIYAINDIGGYSGGISKSSRGVTLETVASTPVQSSFMRKKEIKGNAEKYLEEEISDEANVSQQETTNSSSSDIIPLRSNFNETAFFYPHLTTDANGDILVKFTAPESLTSWKVLGLAHTQDLAFGLFQKEVVTQKELMVQTNLPRFIRSGDEVFLTAKISNMTDSYLGGTAKVQLFDAVSRKDISKEFNCTAIYPDFNIEGKQSAVVTWKIQVPEGVNSLIVRVSAKGGNHTDGEELTIPVLTDKVLVTESMPLTNNGKGTKEYTFEKLTTNTSSTLQHHAVTLEYTSNPAWYVIQALPYMLEYPHDCSEQIFSRFYANSIASNIVKSSPKIKEIFEKWKTSSPEAFLSNLEKNQQLKSVILEETPWVLDAQSENERKKRVALLFDFNKMDNELVKNLKQLTEAQVSNGGFPWFAGMPENRYITQYIVSGMGHLNQLNIVAVKENKDVQKMIQKAVKYLDARLLDDYNEWKKWYEKNKGKNYTYQPTNLQYLYTRSFFPEIKMSKAEEEAFNFYKTNTEKVWTNFELNSQAMLALSSFRNGNDALAQKIMNSILERSITTEEMGMYWKENERGYFWYQAPIETQALLIEALHFIKNDAKAINNAKIWLLRNKQTSDWKTTTATANACYALLLGGNAFTQQNEQVTIEVNGTEIRPEDFGSQAEAGTGYFQKTWLGKEVSGNLGKIKITRKTDGFSYGAMYWQYFEKLEKVTSAETSLKLKKQLFVVRQTASGEVIVPIKDGDKLQRGEKVRVRIELSTDRNMEFVHLKDYRAAGFEPINVLSQYKWQDGLGYYESTKDVATHFFFDYLRKGNYVFEYDIRVSHSGNFTNGFAEIECMYAPEFKSHSSGVRVVVE